MTRPLPLRSEQPPDDAAVVLRAGVMGAENLRRSAERTFALYAVYGINEPIPNSGRPVGR